MIEEMKSIAAEIKKALETPDDQYIIQCEGVIIDVDFMLGRYTGNCSTGCAHNVRRFSKTTAEKIAPSVSNGNGTCGIAIPWVDAARVQLSTIKDMLKSQEERK